MYYPNWGFATVEGLSILEMLKPFQSVTCLHGHVHQAVYKEIEHIRSIGMLSTAWPWPYPPVALPLEMKRMPRSDPGDPFDAVGWGKGFVDLVTQGTQYTVYNEYHIFGRPEEPYPGASDEGTPSSVRENPPATSQKEAMKGVSAPRRLLNRTGGGGENAKSLSVGDRGVIGRPDCPGGPGGWLRQVPRRSSSMRTKRSA
jgi:hypothetical protein